MSSEEQQIKQLLAQAKQIKQSNINIGTAVNSYLSYQLSKIQQKQSFFSCFSHPSPILQVSDDFKRAFKTLSKLQRAQFYLMNLKNVQRIGKLITKSKRSVFNWNGKEMEAPQLKVKKISCFQIKDDDNYENFTLVKAQIYQKLSKIVVNNKQIDLQSYIMRKSRDRDLQNCIVLQAMDSLVVTQTIRIRFGPQEFKDSYAYLYRIWNRSQLLRIYKMISDATFNTLLQEIVKFDNSTQNRSTSKDISSLRSLLIRGSSQLQSNYNQNQ